MALVPEPHPQSYRNPLFLLCCSNAISEYAPNCAPAFDCKLIGAAVWRRLGPTRTERQNFGMSVQIFLRPGSPGEPGHA